MVNHRGLLLGKKWAFGFFRGPGSGVLVKELSPSYYTALNQWIYRQQ